MGYSRYKRGSLNSPGQILPTGNGRIKDSASGTVAMVNAIGTVARELKVQEDQRAAVELSRRMAEFQLNDDKVIEEFSQLPLEQRGVDDLYAQSFEARSTELLNGVTDPRQKRALEQQLNTYYVRGQLTSQKMERARNQSYVADSLEQEISTLTNIVRSNPTRSTEALATLDAALVEASGVLAPEAIADKRTKAQANIQFSAATAMVEANPHDAKRRINNGELDSVISPQMKERLLSQADVEIRTQENEINKEQRLVAGDARKELKSVVDDITSSRVPNFERFWSLVDLAGEEGEDLRPLGEEWETHSEVLRMMFKQPAAKQVGMISALEQKFLRGETTPEEEKRLQLYAAAQESRLKDAVRDGPATAYRLGYIDDYEPLNLASEDSIKEWEERAITIRTQLGPFASVLPVATKQAMVDALRSGSVEDRMSIFKSTVDAPSLRNDIAFGVIQESKSKGASLDPARAIGTALQQFDPTVFEAVIRGVTTHQRGTPVDVANRKKVRMAVFNEYGDIFKRAPQSLEAVTDATIFYLHGTATGAGELKTLDTQAITDSIESVLPGNVIKLDDKRLLTANKEMTESRLKWITNQVAGRDDWYKHIHYYDPTTKTKVALTAPPQFADNTGEVPADILRDLRVFDTEYPGVFTLQNTSGVLKDNHDRVLLFDTTTNINSREHLLSTSGLPGAGSIK